MTSRSRASDTARRIDSILDDMRRRGALKEFNRACQKHRLAAAEQATHS
jgi:hypothetical protein